MTKNDALWEVKAVNNPLRFHVRQKKDPDFADRLKKGCPAPKPVSLNSECS